MMTKSCSKFTKPVQITSNTFKEMGRRWNEKRFRRDPWTEMRLATKSSNRASLSLSMVVPYSCKYSNGDDETSEGISCAHAESQLIQLILMVRDVNRFSNCAFRQCRPNSVRSLGNMIRCHSRANGESLRVGGI